MNNNRATTPIEAVKERLSLLEEYVQQLGPPDELKADIVSAKEQAFQSKTFFTLDEVCAYLGMSKSTIYKLTSGEDIPFFKKNKFLFFDKEDIDTWLYATHRKSSNDAMKTLLKKKKA